MGFTSYICLSLSFALFVCLFFNLRSGTLLDFTFVQWYLNVRIRYAHLYGGKSKLFHWKQAKRFISCDAHVQNTYMHIYIYIYICMHVHIYTRKMHEIPQLEASICNDALVNSELSGLEPGK